jgi:hypothetical protein
MRTMIFLLTDNNIQNFDVIAIQKFWRNLFVSITLSFSQNNFHLLYKSDEDTRICFYVNDKLNTNNWDVKYLTIDICILKLKIKRLDENTNMIRIHNMYNSSFVFYASRDNLLTLSIILRFLNDVITNHHVLLRDFNLYHFLKWFNTIDATCDSWRASKYSRKAWFNADAI